MTFANRTEAGERLARVLAEYRGLDPVVLALPRGGVPVAEPVAAALHAPLDLVVVRKIGLPWQPELAMGAIVGDGEPIVVRNEDVIAASGTDEATFAAAAEAERAEIGRRRARYLAGRPAEPVEGRTAILVDDGIATGATVRAALRALRRRRPARLVLAVPVAPPDALAALQGEADRVVCLEAPDGFIAVGAHYRDFSQVCDAEVVAALERAAARRPADSGPAQGV